MRNAAYSHEFESGNFHDNKYYNDFSKNHLSELFDHGEFLNNPIKMPKRYSKQVREKRKEMSELEKERYGLDETLKALDTKFDQGVISEVDYFRTFKNLQKQIYDIDQKIELLGQEIEEMNFKPQLKDIEGKRYFS
jgi:predicted  nucleic acid-binding Zn-ribbon protein